MSWVAAMGMSDIIHKSASNPPTNEIRIENSKEGDTFRGCMSNNYRENMPHVSHEAFSPIQFRTLSYICISILVMAAIGLFNESYSKRKSAARRKQKESVAYLIAMHKNTREHKV